MTARLGTADTLNDSEFSLQVSSGNLPRTVAGFSLENRRRGSAAGGASGPGLRPAVHVAQSRPRRAAKGPGGRPRPGSEPPRAPRGPGCPGGVPPGGHHVERTSCAQMCPPPPAPQAPRRGSCAPQGPARPPSSRLA